MDSLIILLKEVQIVTLLAMAGMLWFFNNRMDKKIDELKGQIKDVAEDVKDIDRRLCRIEGAMASKDCCMLKDDRQMKKAE